MNYTPVVPGKENVVKFSETQTDEYLIEKIKEAYEILEKEDEVRFNPFPVEIFPKRIQAKIESFHNCYGLPIDYHATSIVVCASIALGNAFTAKFKGTQKYPLSIYATIVGPPGIGKTPALKFGLQPLFDLEKQYRKEYYDLIEKWKDECIGKDENEHPPKPLTKDIIVNDSTVESINSLLPANPKGLLMFVDELKGWLNSMNSYRKGSDLEYYLSVWSGSFIKVTRSGKESIYISNPFVSVIGGIQPKLIKELASDGKTDNGFLSRILFAFPESVKFPYQNDIEPDPQLREDYRQIIYFLQNLPNKIEPAQSSGEFAKIERIDIELNPDAKLKYIEFLNRYTDLMNQHKDNEEIQGVLSKLKQYCLRFSLIIEMLDFAEKNYKKKDYNDWTTWFEVEEIESIKISLPSLEKAILLTKYFLNNSLKVLDQLIDPATTLKLDKKVLYKVLPDRFHRNLAFKVGELIDKEIKESKLSERTVKRMLGSKDPKLFYPCGNGFYEKTF